MNGKIIIQALSSVTEVNNQLEVNIIRRSWYDRDFLSNVLTAIELFKFSDPSIVKILLELQSSRHYILIKKSCRL